MVVSSHAVSGKKEHPPPGLKIQVPSSRHRLPSPSRTIPYVVEFLPEPAQSQLECGFLDSLFLEGPALEKIYLVYTKPEEQKMTQEEAESIFELAKDFMAKREKNVSVIIPGMFTWYYRATELRRRLGLGFKVPPVEAILDTGLMQQFH